jgi:hypothetical protein
MARNSRVRERVHENNAQPDLLSAALSCAARGWSVIPVIDKRSVGLWKPYQKRASDAKTLQRLFGQKGITGLAVILGNASGGLACRDFDRADAYHEWAASDPELAATLPTVKTARGFHVYFAGPDGFETLPDGEYRADAGHYVLLPPSRHPDGLLYRWLVPLPAGKLPEIDPVAVGLVSRLTRSPITPSLTSQLLNNPTSTHCMCPIESAIAMTLPTETGQRNRRLFDLARALKAIMPDASEEERHVIVRRWYGRALPIIGTKDWSESWMDFRIAWGKVRVPTIGPRWSEIVALASSLPAPKGFDRVDGQLVNLFVAAQRLHGPGKAWRMSYQMAANALGVPKDTAWRHLKLLTRDGVVERVKNGTNTGRDDEASEWRYPAAIDAAKPQKRRRRTVSHDFPPSSENPKGS